MRSALVIFAVLSGSVAEAEEPGLIHYTVAADERPHPDADYAFSEWSVGTALCRVEDGTPVVVTSVGARARVEGRVDKYYEVTAKSGGAAQKVFGGRLTPLCVVADVDGDGEPDRVQVFFTAEHKIRVQAAKGFVDVEAHGGGYLGVVGGSATSELVDGKVAGLPLLKVGSHPAACADYGDYWISFVGGVPRLALSADGVADPPVHATPTVRFDPRAATATVTVKFENDEDKPRKKVTRYHRVNGVYVSGKAGSR